MHNTCECNQYNTGHPRSSVAQLGLVRKITTHKVLTSSRSFTRSVRKLSALSSKRLHEVRNAAIIATKVTVTPTQISEVLGQIAQKNYMFVRN